jgi:hypothetical protein
MTISVGIHSWLHSSEYKGTDSFIRYRNNLSLIMSTFLLILVGIAVLPGGLSR